MGGGPLRYAVFGQPVAHSRSPQIHAAFAAQCGIDLVYERIEAMPDAFAAAVDAFARDGGRGANVTLPHKQAAFELCDEVGPRAQAAGAVNTLIRIGGQDSGGSPADGGARWRGDNTDGMGLVRDLVARHGVVLSGARVLLLGAGGAAAGVAPALLEAGVAQLAISNRTFERAADLAHRLGIDAGEDRLHLWDWPALVNAVDTLASAPRGSEARRRHPDFDVVINTTSAARLDDAVAWPLPFDDSLPWTAVDLGYGDSARPFLQAAREAGAAMRIDGLGMLVEQAAESFRLWHGLMPDTQPVYHDLRAALGDPP